MNINVNATIKTAASINPVDVIKVIRDNKFPEDSFVKGDSIYRYMDVGHHKEDIEVFFVSNNTYDVELFLAINTLLEYLKGE